MASSNVISRRRAETVWTGDVQQGSGSVSFRTSKAIPDQKVTLGSRASEEPERLTDPEELIAAAHSSCFAMALSNVLTEAGTPPGELDVRATVELQTLASGGLEVASSTLDVTGRVPGLDQGAFEEAVGRADQGCPVSNALRGGPEVRIGKVTLEA